jgi:hypothetical protein
MKMWNVVLSNPLKEMLLWEQCHLLEVELPVGQIEQGKRF